LGINNLATIILTTTKYKCSFPVSTKKSKIGRDTKTLQDSTTMGVLSLLFFK